MNLLQFISLFLFLAGFVVGLGAVTVIDMLGFLGRKSEYWTEATTRSHKVTKPLIWLGITLAVVGGAWYYYQLDFPWPAHWHALIAVALILNGLFLSFRVSPFLIEREKEGRSSELLPKSWQVRITLSFIVSFLGWWSALGLLVWHLLVK